MMNLENDREFESTKAELIEYVKQNTTISDTERYVVDHVVRVMDCVLAFANDDLVTETTAQVALFDKLVELTSDFRICLHDALSRGFTADPTTLTMMSEDISQVGNDFISGPRD